MKYLLFLIGASVAMTSCQNFFSQTVEIDPPEYTPSMVFHELISDQDDTLKINLTRNYGVLEPVDDYNNWAVKGAVVEWWQNGQKVLTLLPLSADSSQVYFGLLPAPLQAGQEYQIKVSHPDFEPVTATQVLPAPLEKVDNIVLKRQFSTNEFDEPISQLEFNIMDKADEKNFYEFFLEVKSINRFIVDYLPDGTPVYDTFTYNYTTPFDVTFDPNLREGLGNSLLLNDQFTNGQEYKFKGQFIDYQNSDQTQEFYLVTRTITQEYYYWAKSYVQQSNSGDNPLAEPVSVYNNLENGLGIFGMFSEKRFKL